MPTFRETVDVTADPDTAWQIVGDLASVRRWIPGVTEVSTYGLTRVCAFDDGHTQTEQISEYDPLARSYRYTVEGGLPVRDNAGRLSVEPLPDGGARIVWESGFEPLDPAAEGQLVAMWHNVLPMVLSRLAAVIDGGAHTESTGAPFVWYDLHVTGLADAKEFLTDMFGWPVTEAPSNTEMAMIGAGTPWAAITNADIPGWVPYVQVDDVDAAAERAAKLGATLTGTRTEGPAGSYVTIAIPGGAPVALWQARS